MPLDNKISNIIGVRLPEWVLKQLNTRSEQGSKDAKDNNNILYVGNKTSWVRLVSSVDVTSSSSLEDFKNLGANIGRDKASLSKEFVLYGGTSIYLNEKSYEQRSGLGKDGAYSPLGRDEIQKYGYRPMPGITNVSIETQGRLGSVRAATINFKCWDKSQLDIIDALYFRLGYSMFLEWGHTYFYPSTNITIDDKTTLTPDKVASTELLFSLDPFAENLTKEQIYLHISKNSRRSEGNYDGMLGIVTNFNFNYNQEGGYDCMIKVIGLGYLADGIKINNPTGLPNVLKQQIIEYNKLIEAIQNKDATKLPPPAKPKQSELEKSVQNDKGIPNYPSSVLLGQNAKSNLVVDGGEYGDLLFIRKLNGFLPTDTNRFGDKTKIKINKENLNKAINKAKSLGLFNSNNWKEEQGSSGNKKKNVWIGNYNSYVQKGLSYEIKILYETTAETDSNNDSILNLTEIKESIKGQQLKINQNESIGNLTEFKINKTIEQLDTSYIANFAASDFNTLLNQDFVLENSSTGLGYGKLGITKENTQYINEKINQPYTFTVRGYINITRPSDISVSNLLDSRNNFLEEDKTFTGQVNYQVYVEISFQDTDLIQIFNTDAITGFEQPVNFLSERKIIAQNVEQQSKLAQQQAEQSTTPDQSESPLLTLSALEVMLRMIQLQSLGAAVSKNSLNIGGKVNTVKLAEDTQFIKELFSVGVFSDFIFDLINDKINDSKYETETNSKQRLKINAKYGFATNLMAGKESLYELIDPPLWYGSVGKINERNFEPVNYKDLLTTYVLPYEVNQKLNIGTELNHPVYIKLGTLLMLLNHSCTLYDKKTEGVQLPLIYLDFNTAANFCLSNPQQLSTNPLKILIPFEGKNQDYRKLFSDDVLEKEKNEIKKLEGETQTTPLFTPRSNNPDSRDNVSGNLPSFRYGIKDETDYVAYRGKIMNVLININYITDLIGTYSTKDDQNKVFLKPFIDAILTDINKYLGNFNILRLSYNDSANTLQIVDDQLIPVANQNEKQLLKSSNIEAELPLIGKKSIAKSLEIKTEISTKLSNMIAISANSQDQQSQLSTNGDYLGYLNDGLVDRYIPQRTETTSGGKNSQLDGEIRAAIQFNSAIRSFYNSDSPSEDQISFATNYFIERMTKLKGLNPATRAAAMIPVSINFSTDGISGMGMGQSFTVSKEVLPYNYFRKIRDNDKNVGFVVVGLTHTIENNQWNTAVRSNMIFIKNAEDYAPERVEALSKDGEVIDIEKVQGQTLRQIQTPNADRLRRILAELKYEEKNPNREISNWGDITPELVTISQKIFNNLRNNPKTSKLSIIVTSGNDEYHQKQSKGSRHVFGKGLDFTISPATVEDKLNVVEIINKVIKTSGINASFLNEYDNPSDKATGGHFHIQINS